MSSSHLYQTLTHSQLSQLVERHFHTHTFDASLLEGGMFNTTYLIKGLPDSQKVVLRLGPVNRHLLLPFEENLMNGEAYFYELCQQIEVPISQVLACDTTQTFLDRDYMMVAYIESCALSSLTLEESIKDKLYCQTGHYASEIHKITGTHFGRLSRIKSGEKHDTWFGFLSCELSQWKEKMSAFSLFSHAEISDLVKAFHDHSKLFHEITVPHLIHADLWEGNILVKKENDQYEVCAIIDGDRALFGDIDFEFASGWMINSSFLEGYGVSLSMDKNSILRRKLYAILFSLIDAYVCHVEYNKPEEALYHKTKALELLSKLS